MSFPRVPGLRAREADTHCFLLTRPTWVYETYYVGGRGPVLSHLPPCSQGWAQSVVYKQILGTELPPSINLVSNFNT